MSHDKITVVINTFNSEDIIFHCLDSIAPEVKIIVVENSNNLSFKKKLENKYLNVNCFLTGKNLGYGKGNNFGLSKVDTQFALVLNPDAVLEKNTIKNFLNRANNLKDFALIGPAKQNEYSVKDLNSNKEQVFQVNSLKGFAMFFNLDQFKEIGFFDENFFIYLEEIDLCKRLKKKFKKIYLDKSIVVHHIGGSSHNKTINFEMELSRNWHWMWSTFYFYKKHYNYFYALFKVSRKLISSLIKCIFYLILFKNKKKKIYFQRFSGLFNSIIGKKSWYRPKIIIN